MSYLIERLRFYAETGTSNFTHSELLDDAADHIETLEAALRKIEKTCNVKINRFSLFDEIKEIARAALEQPRESL